MIDYLPYIFIALAAFFNAVMDSLENEPNYDKTIFKKLPKQYWLKEQSWKYAPKILGYHCDPWHFSKSLMIVFCVGAIVSAFVVELIFRPWLTFILSGLLWNGVFNLFYSFIFRLK